MAMEKKTTLFFKSNYPQEQEVKHLFMAEEAQTANTINSLHLRALF